MRTVNKCSTCGQGFDNLEDLIVHEAVHDVGPEDELDAEYIGGHIKFKNKMHTTLKLDDDKIDVMPFDPQIHSPSFSIPYKRVIAVELMSSGQSSFFLAIGNNANMLAATAGISILTNSICNKPKLFLVLTFIDEYDIQQSVAFQMQRVEEAQQDIYDRVAQAQRLDVGHYCTP